jgi:ribosomal protein L37AE/L43A
MAKVKEILSYASLIVGIVSGILAISEKVTSWNILASLYPLIDQGTLFIVLLVVTFSSLAAYAIGARSKRSGFLFFAGRRRPSSLSTHNSYETTIHDVRWRVYPPRPLSGYHEAWVEGPYCPKCKRELEEATTGALRKKPIWSCLNCHLEYKRPKGDPKEEVRKDFEAYLRRKGEL